MSSTARFLTLILLKQTQKSSLNARVLFLTTQMSPMMFMQCIHCKNVLQNKVEKVFTLT